MFEIYQTHRIVIPDAPSKGNMLTFNGRPICVDFDVAFNLAQDDSQLALRLDLFDTGFFDYWHNYETLHSKPLTAQICRLLVFIETLRDDFPELEAFATQKTIAPFLALNKIAQKNMADMC